MDLFKHMAEMVKLQSETLMVGIDLGRKESEERIRKLEAENKRLLDKTERTTKEILAEFDEAIKTATEGIDEARRIMKENL